MKLLSLCMLLVMVAINYVNAGPPAGVFCIVDAVLGPQDENPTLNCAPQAGIDKGLCIQRSKKCLCQEGRLLAWHKNAGCQCMFDW